MNDYVIVNEYDNKEYAFINKVIKKALNYLNIEKSVFSVVLINDEKIQFLNKKYRNIDKVTDVLSFAFEDNSNIKNNEIRVLGDIFISIPQMERQAAEYDNTIEEELSFLVVHGLLHLLGYDHMTKDEEIKMFAIQKEILK